MEVVVAAAVDHYLLLMELGGLLTVVDEGLERWPYACCGHAVGVAANAVAYGSVLAELAVLDGYRQQRADDTVHADLPGALVTTEEFPAIDRELPL
jgi:hypothetical protein